MCGHRNRKNYGKNTSVRISLISLFMVVYQSLKPNSAFKYDNPPNLQASRHAAMCSQQREKHVMGKVSLSEDGLEGHLFEPDSFPGEANPTLHFFFTFYPNATVISK